MMIMKKEFTEDQKVRAKSFINELQEISMRYGIDIDCHADFVSLLTDRRNNDEILAVLRGDCEPEYEWEED
jgi:hypothetical protein